MSTAVPGTKNPPCFGWVWTAVSLRQCEGRSSAGSQGGRLFPRKKSSLRPEQVVSVNGAPTSFRFAVIASRLRRPLPILAPDGQITHTPVQPLLKKYSGFPKAQITLYPPLSCPSERGVGHRHERWGGMRWTRGSAQDESAFLRTEKSCGPDASTPASSL